MLQRSILKTIKYFDIQDHCLTLLELYKYLLRAEAGQGHYSIGEILDCLENELAGEVEKGQGFYFLVGRNELVKKRLGNNLYAAVRHKRIKRFSPFLRYVPFISAVALAGSEALNNSKNGSDIDLLVFTKKNRIWTGRLAISFFFQVFGVRRHGKKIADRFCLNHYVEENKKMDFERHIYTAIEYTSLIPLFGADKIYEFQTLNLHWIGEHLVQPQITKYETKQGAWIKKAVEVLDNNPLGNAAEKVFGYFQKHKIKISDDVIVEKDELSFHPNNKGRQVLRKFSEAFPPQAYQHLQTSDAELRVGHES